MGVAERRLPPQTTYAQALFVACGQVCWQTAQGFDWDARFVGLTKNEPVGEALSLWPCASG